MTKLIALALAILSSLGLATPANAASRPAIYVQEYLSGSYDKALRSAIAFDGKYTHSRIVIHHCDSSHRCITVRANGLPHVAHGTVVTSIISRQTTANSTLTQPRICACLCTSPVYGAC